MLDSLEYLKQRFAALRPVLRLAAGSPFSEAHSTLVSGPQYPLRLVSVAASGAAPSALTAAATALAQTLAAAGAAAEAAALAPRAVVAALAFVPGLDSPALMTDDAFGI